MFELDYCANLFIMALFAKLKADPKLEYTEDELYDSIKSNLENIINERNPTISEIMSKKSRSGVSESQDMERKIRGRVKTYEPRLDAFELKIGLREVEIQANVMHGAKSVKMVFTVELHST